MELTITTCIQCAKTGKPFNEVKERDNVLEIRVNEKCGKCGKDIVFRGVKIEMEKKFWGGMNFSLTRY